MSKRLTDEELLHMYGLGSDNEHRAAEELRARRSADLSEADLLALNYAREVVLHEQTKRDSNWGKAECESVVAVLDRLLAAAEGEV